MKLIIKKHLTLIGYVAKLPCMNKYSKRDRKLATLKADVLKAMGHPTRLMIIEMLAGGERCVCELNKIIRADHSTISKHLSLLKKAGVVSDRKEGLKVFYKLEVPCIIKFMNCITSVIESRVNRDLSALTVRSQSRRDFNLSPKYARGNK